MYFTDHFTTRRAQCKHIIQYICATTDKNEYLSPRCKKMQRPEIDLVKARLAPPATVGSTENDSTFGQSLCRSARRERKPSRRRKRKHPANLFAGCSPCGEVVGVARFELAALRSRTVRATKLRYTPKRLLNCSQPQPRECSRSVFGGASRSPKALPKVLRNTPSCFVRSRPAFSLGEGTNLIATQTALHPEKVIKLSSNTPQRVLLGPCLVARRAHRRRRRRAVWRL